MSPQLATRLRSTWRASVAPAEEPGAAPFKAAPVPDFSRHYVGPKAERPALTEPEPFSLSTDERHRLHEEDLRRRVRAEVRSHRVPRGMGRGMGARS